MTTKLKVDDVFRVLTGGTNRCLDGLPKFKTFRANLVLENDKRLGITTFFRFTDEFQAQSSIVFDVYERDKRVYSGGNLSAAVAAYNRIS